MSDAFLTSARRAAQPAHSSTVRLVYLARLREAFGSPGETFELDNPEGMPITELVAALRARGGTFARELAAGRAFRVALNHTMADHDAVAHAGDEVAFLPPVTGG